MPPRTWLGLVLCCALFGVGCGDDDAPTPDASTDANACARACDDGQFCNGAERCDPLDPEADTDGCVAGAPPCEGMCVEASAECRSDCVDADGDGAFDATCGGSDCDDADPERFPGNREVCDDDGHDEDCDDSTFGPDEDGDGFVSSECCNGARCGMDCDDGSYESNPDGDEECDGRDNDCDGDVDEGQLETYYRDRDGDGFGDDADSTQACTVPLGHVLRPGDCDDTNVNASSVDAVDGCDGHDNDCDDRIDEDFELECFDDFDRDGYAPAGAEPMLSCRFCPTGTTDRRPLGDDVDCDDRDELESPGRMEECDPAGRDDDCDGESNPPSLCTCATGTTSTCGTEFGSLGACGARLVTCVDGRWSGDCDPDPGVVERCDGVDSDCDGRSDDDDVDADRTTFCLDADDDGAGDPGVSRLSCGPVGDYVSNCSDCNDRNPVVASSCETETVIAPLNEQCEDYATHSATADCGAGYEVESCNTRMGWIKPRQPASCGVRQEGNTCVATLRCGNDRAGEWLDCDAVARCRVRPTYP